MKQSGPDTLNSIRIESDQSLEEVNAVVPLSEGTSASRPGPIRRAKDSTDSSQLSQSDEAHLAMSIKLGLNIIKGDWNRLPTDSELPPTIYRPVRQT